MIYAYDRAMLMPVRDLYDTQMMAMAINAAKEEYNKAEDRLDKLNDIYGNFYSPSDVDMASWQREVVLPFKNTLDDLLRRGVDPLRSAEGLAALARLKSRIPYDQINRLKQSAAIGQKYLENVAKLLAAGLYNPDYENRYLGYDLRNWDTLKNGVWDRLSPDQSPSLQDATQDWYKARTARQLTPEEVAATGLPYDSNMDYTGYLDSDLMNVAGLNIPGFMGTQIGGYYADLARRELETAAVNAGIDPKIITQEDVNRRLALNIAGANRGFLIAPKGEANPFRLDDYRTRNDIRAYWSKQPASNGNNYPTIKDSKGRTIPVLSLDNHNARLEATGIANLFGGKYANMSDYVENFYNWGDKMKDVENDIIYEISNKTKTKSGYSYNYDTNVWKDRHMTNYAPGNFADYMKRRGASLKGSGSGPQVVINDEIINNLYTLGEVMQKNANLSVRSRGHNRSKSKLERSDLQTRINAGGAPYMHSTGRIFTQCGDDNKIHHYAEVYVKRKPIDSNADNADKLLTKIMYFDMGLESAENSLVENPSLFQLNAYSNYYGTRPYAQGAKDASVRTQ